MENEEIVKTRESEKSQGTEKEEAIRASEKKEDKKMKVQELIKNLRNENKEIRMASVKALKELEEIGMRTIEYKRNRMGWTEIRGKELSREWEEHIVPACQIPEYWVRIQGENGKWSDWIGTNLSPVVKMANGEIW